jgi:photosystem II stability/assembly factor-like uncharacterized protein
MSAMTTPTVLVATWGDGLFVVTGETCQQELSGQPVNCLAPDGHGGALAIVGGRSLRRRTAAGEWQTLAEKESGLSCCMSVGDVSFVGTDDAQVLRIDAHGKLSQLPGLNETPGRDRWYAGTAVVHGKVVGPPLGIRSMTATCDDAVLLANVHVGGIPRSADGGVTWRPTIEVEHDVHQVCAHPTRPEIVIAAAASGLCVSKDSGKTWNIEQDGLHAAYCSAVAFAGDDILVAASEGHFAAHGAIYRRPIDAPGPLLPVGGGLPRWLGGIADTGLIASRDAAVAVIDRAGNLSLSEDAGRTWSRRIDALPGPSWLLIP